MRAFALLICLCSTVAATSARAQADAAAVDRAVFDVLVREAADSTWEVLLVDVRPLREGADLTGLDPEDVDGGDSALSASRAAVLGRLGIQPTDALAERRCLFTTGVQREPRPADPARSDTLVQMRQACRQRAPFVVLMAGRPEPVASGGAGRTVRVRVLRFSTYAYGYWDYTLRCDSDGRWTVVERRRHLNVMS